MESQRKSYHKEVEKEIKGLVSFFCLQFLIIKYFVYFKLKNVVFSYFYAIYVIK